LIEDVQRSATPERGVEILLDEQNRHPGSFDFPDDGLRPRARSAARGLAVLSTQQHRFSCTSARAIASICFSPPEISSPLLASRSRKRGKRS